MRLRSEELEQICFAMGRYDMVKPLFDALGLTGRPNAFLVHGDEATSYTLHWRGSDDVRYTHQFRGKVHEMGQSEFDLLKIKVMMTC